MATSNFSGMKILAQVSHPTHNQEKQIIKHKPLQPRTYKHTEKTSGGAVLGPTTKDLGLPQDQEYELKQSYDPTNSFQNSKRKYPTFPLKGGRDFLSFWQLNALALILIILASGMANPEDFAFVFISLVYTYFISKVAFPSLHPSLLESPVLINPHNMLLHLYVLAGALIGLFLPIAYNLHGIIEGDYEGIKAATPHVFLLSSQVFMEGVASSDRFSSPIRVLLPVCYNARRVFTIVDWLRSDVLKVDENFGGSTGRLYAGRGLAIANMAFWCFNLFGLLLPVYVPRTLKGYYSEFKVED